MKIKKVTVLAAFLSDSLAGARPFFSAASMKRLADSTSSSTIVSATLASPLFLFIFPA